MMDRGLFLVATLVLFIITFPYILVTNELAIIILHLVLSASTVWIAYTVTFGYNTIRYLSGLFFAFWYAANCFGFARLITVTEFSSGEVVFIYLLTLIAVWGCALGCLASIPRRKKTRSFLGMALVPRIRQISTSLYLWLFTLTVMFAGVEIHFAGGLKDFFLSPYAEIYPPGTENFFFVLRQLLFNGFYYLSLAVAFDRTKSKFAKWLGWTYVFIFYSLAIMRKNTGVLCTAPIVPWLYLYSCYYNVGIRRRHPLIIGKRSVILGLAVGVFLVGFVIAHGVRFTRGEGKIVHFLNVLQDVHVVDSLIKSRTFDHIENFGRILRHYKGNYSFGKNLIQPFVNFIPRAIWQAKPVGLGRRIVIEIYGAPYDTPVSFATSMLGDFYVDFGLIGVIVMPFLMGIVLGSVERLFTTYRQNVYVSFIYLNTAIVFLNLVPTFSGFGIRYIYMLAFWHMVSVLSRIKWGVATAKASVPKDNI